MSRWSGLVTVVALAAVAGCGRIGYDERPLAVDAPAVVDAPPLDGLPACPAGTTESCPGSTVCIETAERGYTTWMDAGAQCAAVGRRLCTDPEWALACQCAIGLVDMVDSEWEWLAEESGGIAQKRGYESCDATSTHPITDSYDFRCCADR
jgi:hypothetical protein